MTSATLMFASFSPDKTGIVVMLAIAMVVMAYIDFKYLKIHNVLTFPVILAGWIYATFNGWMTGADIEVYLPTNWFGFEKFVMFELGGGPGGAMQGLWHSLGLTFLGFLLLLPLYAIKGVGGGDVKMQMGFGAWVAPIYGWEQGFNIVLMGFCVGAIVGGILSIIIIWWKGTYKKNVENARNIVTDLFTKKYNDMYEKATERKAGLQLVPYGVPLGIGYLMYVFWEWYTASSMGA
jgi:prepilin peptidase CpaA